MYELISAGENTYYMDCPAKVGIVRTGAGRGVLLGSQFKTSKNFL